MGRFGVGVAPLRVGQVVRDEHGPARVMAIAEGYAMLRRKGCLPFVAALKDVMPDPAYPAPKKEP